MAQTITKEMLIPEVIKVHKDVPALLMSVGMHCLGCPSHQHESLEEAAVVHGLPIDTLVEELNKYIANHPE